MEPTNLFQTSMIMFHVNFQGCNSRGYHLVMMVLFQLSVEHFGRRQKRTHWNEPKTLYRGSIRTKWMKHNMCVGAKHVMRMILYLYIYIYMHQVTWCYSHVFIRYQSMSCYPLLANLQLFDWGIGPMPQPFCAIVTKHPSSPLNRNLCRLSIQTPFIYLYILYTVDTKSVYPQALWESSRRYSEPFCHLKIQISTTHHTLHCIQACHLRWKGEHMREAS